MYQNKKIKKIEKYFFFSKKKRKKKRDIVTQQVFFQETQGNQYKIHSKVPKLNPKQENVLCISLHVATTQL
jgi:hypothetical protein